MGRRRGNGEGTIYRRPDGRWAAQVTVGRRADGRPQRLTLYGKTRVEVAQKLLAAQAQQATGALPPPSRQTVAEYLRAWLETHRRFGGRDGRGLQPNTLRAYRNLLERHILPAIGSLPLQKLHAAHLEGLYTAMLDRGFSMRLAEMAHRVLHVALEAAVEKNLLSVNPCDRVPRKPRAHYRAEDRPRLTQADAARVLEAVAGTRFYLPFLLAMATGMRRGEIIGLRWQDIDLEQGVIHVRHQLQRGTAGRLTLQDVKTRSSLRDIPVHPQVVAELRQHQARQGVVAGDGFVFTTSTGHHFQLADLDRAWARVRRTLNLPETMRFHDIRGSWATWAAEKRLPLKTAMTILGHADERTLLRVYQSVTAEMTREAAGVVDGVLRATSS